MCVFLILKFLPFGFTHGAVAIIDNGTKCIVLRDDKEFMFNLYDRVSWSIERLIWMAFYKNEENNECLIAQLPKDIVKRIIDCYLCDSLLDEVL